MQGQRKAADLSISLEEKPFVLFSALIFLVFPSFFPRLVSDIRIVKYQSHIILPALLLPAGRRRKREERERERA